VVATQAQLVSKSDKTNKGSINYLTSFNSISLYLSKVSTVFRSKKRVDDNLYKTSYVESS